MEKIRKVNKKTYEVWLKKKRQNKYNWYKRFDYTSYSLMFYSLMLTDKELYYLDDYIHNLNSKKDK